MFTTSYVSELVASLVGEDDGFNGATCTKAATVLTAEATLYPIEFEAQTITQIEAPQASEYGEDVNNDIGKLQYLFASTVAVEPSHDADSK